MKKHNLYTQTALTGTFAILLLFSSCNSGTEKKVKGPGLATIDLVEAYDNRTEVSLSAFAESIEYVPLETIEESLIARNPDFQVTDENIIVSAHQQVLAFNKASGSFLRKVGTRGEGPDEYMQVDRYFNESTGYTYVNASNGKHMALNVNGEIKNTLITPSSDSTLVMGFAQVNDSTFVGFHGNYNCNQKYKLVFFNESGEELKLIYNHETCLIENPNSFYIFFNEGVFSKSKNQTFFKETYNDTLFQIVNMDLKPEAVFDLGSKGIPYQERLTNTTPESKLELFETRLLDVTEQNIFFQLRTQGQTFNGVFNRESGETMLSDIGRTEMHGFVNDLDNFLPFVPQYATDNNQLVGYIEAPDVLAWFKENPEKAAQLPANLKKLGDMKPDDNPVVMIVGLKN
ncbi:MAG: 6-bladed beta-propeller [Cytophagia bacterium]|nr:6-bladed beta-propeller [Cytophagia bacterium]